MIGSHGLLKGETENLVETTKIVLTPVVASPSQQRKHKCEMILSPTRKSIRLMKKQKEEKVVDKLIETQYAYANNKCLPDSVIDS